MNSAYNTWGHLSFFKQEKSLVTRQEPDFIFPVTLGLSDFLPEEVHSLS